VGPVDLIINLEKRYIKDRQKSFLITLNLDVLDVPTSI
jgi:hypothetical protein